MKTKRVQWQYYFARKFSAQRYETILKIPDCAYYVKHFNVKEKNILVVPNGANHAIYMDGRTWPVSEKRVFKVVCKDLATFNRSVRVWRRSQTNFVQTAQKAASGNLANLTQKQLLQRFKQWDRARRDFFIKPIWVPFIIEPLLSQETYAKLETYFAKKGTKEVTQKYCELVFSPTQKNAITKEHEALLRIAQKVINQKRTQKLALQLIKKHWKKWQWIPCYDIADIPWNIKDFQKRFSALLKNPSTIKLEIKRINANLKNKRRRFQSLLSDFQFPKKLCEMFIMAQKLVMVKDERDDYRRLGTFLILPLYNEIAKRMGLSRKESAQLLNKEIISFLRFNKLPDLNKVKERVRGYGLLKKNGGRIAVYSGAELEELKKHELGEQTEKRHQKIHGIVGSSGNAKGVVVIVKTKHDLRLVKQGNIMVAVTTHPDFVPAMKKCKAIVTDEGGITSHAAIVSREFNIPCIVGCKVATDVLKNGDVVEVDGVKGEVRKIDTQ